MSTTPTPATDSNGATRPAGTLFPSKEQLALLPQRTPPTTLLEALTGILEDVHFLESPLGTFSAQLITPEGTRLLNSFGHTPVLTERYLPLYDQLGLTHSYLTVDESHAAFWLDDFEPLICVVLGPKRDYHVDRLASLIALRDAAGPPSTAIHRLIEAGLHLDSAHATAKAEVFSGRFDALCSFSDGRRLLTSIYGHNGVLDARSTPAGLVGGIHHDEDGACGISFVFNPVSWAAPHLSARIGANRTQAE